MAVYVKYLSVTALGALTSLQLDGQRRCLRLAKSVGAAIGVWSGQDNKIAVWCDGKVHHEMHPSPPLIGVPLRVCPCPVVLGPGLAVVGFNMVQGAGPPLTAGNAGSRDWRGDSKSKLVIPISRSWRLLDLEGSR